MEHKFNVGNKVKFSEERLRSGNGTREHIQFIKEYANKPMTVRALSIDDNGNERVHLEECTHSWMWMHSSFVPYFEPTKLDDSLFED
jgi:hypothetical protein